MNHLNRAELPGFPGRRCEAPRPDDGPLGRHAPDDDDGQDGRRRTAGGRARRLIAALITAAAIAVPAAAQEAPLDPACAPEVATALEAAATTGAQGEFLVIRDPENGIRNPVSILDFSCIDRLFNYSLYNIFFDPGRAMNEILGLANRTICRLARQAYLEAIGRPMAPSFIRDIRKLPGVSVRRTWGNVLDDLDPDDELTRTIFQEG